MDIITMFLVYLLDSESTEENIIKFYNFHYVAILTYPWA